MIEHIIQEYLFIKRKCPLPSVGSLELVEGNATAWHNEKRFTAPAPFILFNHHPYDSSALVAYIAGRKNCSSLQADADLQSFCNRLLELQHDDEVILDAAGHFFVDADGKLSFRQRDIPHAFLPEVTATSIRRNDAVHTMKVGDTEKNSVEMAEFFQEQSGRTPDRWWIWAAALFILAASLVAVYWTGDSRTPGFGNAEKVYPAAEVTTYQSSN